MAACRPTRASSRLVGATLGLLLAACPGGNSLDGGGPPGDQAIPPDCCTSDAYAGSIGLTNQLDVERFAAQDHSGEIYKLVDFSGPEITSLTSLEGIEVDVEVLTFQNTSLGRIDQLSGFRVIDMLGASGNPVLESISNLPRTTTLESAVFRRNDVLREVSLPQLTSLPDFLFTDCPMLCTIDIGTAAPEEFCARSEIKGEQCDGLDVGGFSFSSGCPVPTDGGRR